MKTNFNFRIFYFFIFACLFCSCSQYVIDKEHVVEDNGGRMVTLNVNVPDWKDVASRAGKNTLFPLNILLAPKDIDEVAKIVTFSERTEQFSINFPLGDYDVYAVCGLPTNKMPSQISKNVDVRDEKGNFEEFAVGSTNVTIVETSVPEPITIDATRQIAKLDLRLTDVPASFSSLNVFAKDLCNTYTIDCGWGYENADGNSFTKIPVAKSKSEEGVYEADIFLPPSKNNSAVYPATFVLELTTSGGQTMHYSYESTASLEAGKILQQEISFSQFHMLDGIVNLEDWGTSEDNGDINTAYDFPVGSQYFTYPATVYFVTKSKTMLTLFMHKPMAVTLAEIRSWNNDYFNNLQYDLETDLKVNGYAFAVSDTAPNHFLTMLKTTGLNKLNAQIKSSGFEPIDPAATNVLAYYDKEKGKFYRYDFQKLKLVAVDETVPEDYVIYPTGLLNLTH